MTSEKLKELNSLQHEIDQLEKIINSCKNQKCEWIEFTFGNGSNSANVCNDPETIETVRNLLIVENERKLNNLRSKFESL